jgi:hypothetical protein
VTQGQIVSYSTFSMEAVWFVTSCTQSIYSVAATATLNAQTSTFLPGTASAFETLATVTTELVFELDYFGATFTGATPSFTAFIVFTFVYRH